MSVILIELAPKPPYVYCMRYAVSNMAALDTLARSAGARATGVREDFDAFAFQRRTERGARRFIAVAAGRRGARFRQQDRGRAGRPAPLFRAMGAGGGRRQEGFRDCRGRIQSADRLEARAADRT